MKPTPSSTFAAGVENKKRPYYSCGCHINHQE